jgi:hypothetical protein
VYIEQTKRDGFNHADMGSHEETMRLGVVAATFLHFLDYISSSRGFLYIIDIIYHGGP